MFYKRCTGCNKIKPLWKYHRDKSGEFGLKPRCIDCNNLYRREYRKKKNVDMPGFGSWRAMKLRCYQKSMDNYARYGGKGIRVCDRWLGPGGFERFYMDMGPRPEGWCIDRINPLGDYEPENCRWLPLAENSRRMQRDRHK